MTLTIDLSPAEQARLTDAARQTGLEPAALAKKLVTEHLPQVFQEKDTREQARIATIMASVGSMAHVGVEDLHRERQADKAKEEQWIAEYREQAGGINMAQPQASRKISSKRAKIRGATTNPEVANHQTQPQDVVVFTSFDGTVREVGDLPLNLGRATALANERAAGKIWGTPQEETACDAMRKGI